MTRRCTFSFCTSSHRDHAKRQPGRWSRMLRPIHCFPRGLTFTVKGWSLFPGPALISLRGAPNVQSMPRGTTPCSPSLLLPAAKCVTRKQRTNIKSLPSQQATSTSWIVMHYGSGTSMCHLRRSLSCCTRPWRKRQRTVWEASAVCCIQVEHRRGF